MLMKHTIAGINFLTDVGEKQANIRDHGLQKFLIEEAARIDVFHILHRIEEEDLILPALSEKEREQILQCNLQTRLGPGSFILPPLVRKKERWEGGSEDSEPIQDVLDLPLFRSPLVREHLKVCMEHPKQIRLTLHLFTIEIYDYKLHRIDVFYRSELQWILDSYPLENGFRRMFTSFLPSFSCVMLHSSGIIRNDRAYLFIAPDAGGKSTVLKNRKTGIVLSDDQNIIRKENGIYNVHSTPWGHLNSGPQMAQLGGMFLIEKAPNFNLVPIKSRELFEFLWEEHMHVWDVLPKRLRTISFDILADVCYHTPCYKMSFSKNHVDWDAIDVALGHK